MKRFAFVVPRFSEGIAGGAETLISSLAAHLSAKHEVELLTTCARDNRTWENYYPEGSSIEGGLKVRRFAVDPRDLEVWVPLQIKIAEGLRLDLDQELAWMENGVNSSGLYRYIQRRAPQLDALFFGPYLFGTTLFGSLIAPERSILVPCLHDEYYAYTKVVGGMFRQVRGCMFNSVPEMELARSLYGEIAGGEVGMGFDPPTENELSDLKPYFTEKWPYIVYIGRKETGKNVAILIDYFIEAKERGMFPELRLVVAGGGSFSDLHRPAALSRNDIVDLEHLSERDKQRLIRHALVLCQPSTNESFSIVLMESWLLGVPGVVHARCQVTRTHVVDSGGGLYFGDAREFAAVIEALLNQSDLRRELALAGREYVINRYSWESVLNRFEAVAQGLLAEKEIAPNELSGT